jgi:hypothetical protein
MSAIIPHLFADVTAKLEDLHAVAVEGQRADNAPDMQSALNAHLRTGLGGVNRTMRSITVALEANKQRGDQR